MQKFLKKIRKIFYGFKSADRRKYPRYQPTKTVRCVGRYSLGNKDYQIDLNIINISRGGMLVSSSKSKFFPSTKIVVEFTLENGEIILIPGQIGRTYRAYKQDWYYSSIEFTNPVDENITKLLTYLLK
ncbi:MAG: PilZ domain-containing protein [Candidatus Omnitrophica bacterium]|nr:PilZ domain-containing protein [Candidatus Omnitrophota bacterium]